MRRIYIIICLCVYLLSVWLDTPHLLGFYDGSPLWTRVSYAFTHVSVIHLLLNLIVIYSLSTNLSRWNYLPKNLLITSAIVGAFLATFGAEKSLPTIGGSGIVYFLVGIWVANQSILKPQVLALCLVMAASNLLMGHFTNTNTTVHFLAAVYGALFSYTYNKVKQHERKKKQKAEQAGQTGTGPTSN